MGIRALFISCILTISIYAVSQNLEITADKFTHIESENKAIFEGHAVAKDGNSSVKADRFIIYLDKNNKAKKYNALGHVQFEIIKPNQHIKGRCDSLIYKVTKEVYILKGHAYLEDILHKRTMSGDELYLDNLKKEAKAKSDHKKPVKFIFQLKDVKDLKGNKK